MLREYWKEIVLAAVLTFLLFLLTGLLGVFVAPEEGAVEISAGLMAFSIAALVLPPFIGAILSGFLIARKTKDIKAIVLRLDWEWPSAASF